MARREKSSQPKRSRLKKAKKAISRSAKKLTSRLRPAGRREEEKEEKPKIVRPTAVKVKSRKRGDGKAARPARRETDIPFEVLDRTYTPKQTSLKAPFRASGVERQRDQELAEGYADERWNDEDRFTNKSGDPRIGTHHRKYEPGE